jgi:hypothetical protein
MQDPWGIREQRMDLIEDAVGALWGLYILGCVVTFFTDENDFIDAVTWPWAAYKEIKRTLSEP